MIKITCEKNSPCAKNSQIFDKKNFFIVKLADLCEIVKCQCDCGDLWLWSLNIRNAVFATQSINNNVSPPHNYEWAHFVISLK